MTLLPTAPPRPMYGCGHLTEWLRQKGATTVALVTDQTLTDTPILATVRARIVAAGVQVRFFVLPDAGNLDSVLRLADRFADCDLVVGVGGGSVIDQVKLAATLCGNPKARGRLTVAQRSGTIILPVTVERRTPLLAIPTTLGTGTELSAVACLVYPEGKRIISGLCLRPDAAVLDPLATETLPVELVAEGTLEALFRTVSPYIGDHADLPEQDTLVEAVAAELVRLGDEVNRLRRRGEPISPQIRLRIAELSGRSQLGDLHAGRKPYAVKGWAIANELSWELSLRKMPAIAALLSPLWRRIADGDHRIGSAPRLVRIWQRLAENSPGLPDDPAEGIAALIERWQIDHRITADPAQLDTVAARAVHAWGAGLPVLGGLTQAEIRQLLADAVADRALAPGTPQTSVA